MKFIFSKNNRAENKKSVILIHGLARTYRSMKKLGNFLSQKGFNVIYIDYPSRKFSIETLVDLIHEGILKNNIPRGEDTHIVTHSLGGIIVRLYAQKYGLHVGRVVMIAPPNKGSEVADHLSKLSLVKKIMGPALSELKTSDESLPNRLGIINFQLGIIAGTKSSNPLFSAWIQGENDGKVSLESTKTKGMKDFIAMPYGHTFICDRRKVLEQVVTFIESGGFFRLSI